MYLTSTSVTSAQLVEMNIDKKLAIAALRQTNNFLDAALTAIQTQPPEVLLRQRRRGRAQGQDQGQGQGQSSQLPPVDEMALVQLMVSYDRPPLPRDRRHTRLHLLQRF